MEPAPGEVLPVGYHRFARSRFVNYQLNRWYSLGFTRFDDVAEAGRRIRSFEDNARVFGSLAGAAEAEGRLRNAAFYYRAAEFLVDPADPAKLPLYQRFRETFDAGFIEEEIERELVPYGDGALSAARLTPRGPARGTVVIHGGFDSFIEEFFCFWRFFRDLGYEVVAFDGPGQGASHRLHGVPHDHDWEKPVGRVLDHFGLEDVTLLGISFGGYWCVRAAAFDKRISRVIVHPPLFDLLAPYPPTVQGFLHWMVRHERFMAWSIRTRTALVPVLRHAVRNCLYITNQLDREPTVVVPWFLGMNAAHLHSELVDQHVLITVGAADRFQSPRLASLQAAALTNARSVTSRVFTSAENAQNHCQMGNLGLALSVMADWLEAHSGRDGQA
ncbi:MAG: alpha/beta fold hydrolase [Propionibacteriaceae bacterium]|nr:alpha/beta fold hydrolase [Propionibacteriaceae bacterium]